MRLALALLVAAFALASCGKGEPVSLDIESIERAPVVMFPIPDAASGAVTYNVHIASTVQLATLLERRGQIELKVFDCAAPDEPGISLPVYFGGEAVNDLAPQQISSDRDMSAQLNVAVPPVTSAAPRCARFVGLEGAFSPDVISRPVPLPES
jgi:hypothetical protein